MYRSLEKIYFERLGLPTGGPYFRVPHQVGSRNISTQKPFERIRLRIISSGNEWQSEGFGPKQEQEHKPQA